jgi:stage II sporulation protein D
MDRAKSCQLGEVRFMIVARIVTSVLSRVSPSLGWLTPLVWLLAIAPAMAMELRVGIEKGLREVKVGSSTAATVKDGSGQILGQLQGMQAFLAVANGNQIALSQWEAGQLWIEPTDGGVVYIGDRWYRGRTHLVISEGGVTAVNHVDMDEYLYSVVGAEMSPSWHAEALKAQAVAARSYALYQKAKRGNSVYDVGDDTYWQVYVGMEKEDANTIAAVTATSNQVLAYNGSPIEAVFHSSSGGHTEDVENIWQDPRPYLRGVPDYDRNSPNYQWTETFSQNQLSSLFSGVGNVLNLQPAQTTPFGRAITLNVVGDGGTRSIDGDSVRSVLNLPSTLFSVTANGGSFVVSGRGFGHGVGMSQWGALALAESGYSYSQILGHYYQNTTLSQLQ